MRNLSVKSILISSLLVCVPTMASAEEIIVKMLNKGSDGTMMVFEPQLVKANVGDTVRFVATDPSHNAETIKGMIPDGATGFKGKMNQDVVFDAAQPGVYGVKCMPHYGMGMVSLVIVGDETPNLEEAKSARHVGKAKTKFAELFAKVEE